MLYIYIYIFTCYNWLKTLGVFLGVHGAWKVVESPCGEEWLDPSNVKEEQKASGGSGKWPCDVRKNTHRICED